jgi:hypothetical protein
MLGLFLLLPIMPFVLCLLGVVILCLSKNVYLRPVGWTVILFGSVGIVYVIANGWWGSSN